MDSTMAAIEMTGTIDENHRLQIDGTLPVSGPRRVRVLVLYPLADDWEEEEWLHAAARNPAFASLHDPAEDIYTLSDGELFRVDSARTRKPATRKAGRSCPSLARVVWVDGVAAQQHLNDPPSG